MLIRSQDKKILIPVDKFVLTAVSMWIIATSTENPSSLSLASRIIIGQYSTEKKAIKVFDMIQQSYENSLYCDHAFDNAAQVQRPYIFASNTVFQMPQDSEVEE